MNALIPSSVPSVVKRTLLRSLWLCLAFFLTPLYAEVASNSPLVDGWYAAPMAGYVEPGSNRMLDGGMGGTLALGYRPRQTFAVELFGIYSRVDRQVAPSDSAVMTGGGVGVLAFINEALPGAYIPLAIGYLEVDNNGAEAEEYKGLSIEAGLGYLLPFSLGRYDFAVRVEGRYRHHNGQDGRRLDEDASGVQDALFNLGLQLPFGRAPQEPVEKPEPVRVVEAAPPPDDDADGVTNDVDECPNSRDPQKVDGTGCAIPPPPCGTTTSEGALAVAGCAAGDTIVLRDVRFSYNSATLTDDDRRILENVAAALAAYPEIRVEIGGHTDSTGSSAYNARLSERRAEAVRQYLVGEGVGANRMTARGYGESQPIADNSTQEGRELNRRVELTVIDQ